MIEIIHESSGARHSDRITKHIEHTNSYVLFFRFFVGAGFPVS